MTIFLCGWQWRSPLPRGSQQQLRVPPAPSRAERPRKTLWTLQCGEQGTAEGPRGDIPSLSQLRALLNGEQSGVCVPHPRPARCRRPPRLLLLTGSCRSSPVCRDFLPDATPELPQTLLSTPALENGKNESFFFTLLEVGLTSAHIWGGEPGVLAPRCSASCHLNPADLLPGEEDHIFQPGPT